MCSHNFKASSEEVIAIRSEKIKENTRRRMFARVFFVNLQAGISQIHYEFTSSLIIFRHFN